MFFNIVLHLGKNLTLFKKLTCNKQETSNVILLLSVYNKCSYNYVLTLFNKMYLHFIEKYLHMSILCCTFAVDKEQMFNFKSLQSGEGATPHYHQLKIQQICK